MSSLSRTRVFWILVLSLLLILGAGANNEDGETKEDNDDEEEVEIYSPEPDENATQISTYNEERLTDQADIEEDVIEEYEHGIYTLDEPFIKVDPYDTSPLSALI